ncbi:MAG: DHH family phosphoesterase [Oscillospiraceae bacterium]|nr:DHH family phosphoesterase [Oscillospiraceae bacterium]
MMQQSVNCVEIDSRAAYEKLCSLQDVNILIHRSPDGDCIGGGYALYHLLRQKGIRSRVVCADVIPETFQSVTAGIQFESFEPKAYISVDVADRNLLGDLPEEIKNAEIVLCIDHHISNTHYADTLYWNPNSGAACEVLFRMLEENSIPLTSEIAECLYLGMATDTGCFQFSNADASIFQAVSVIKSQYPDLPYARINRKMFVEKSKGRMQLDARVMQNIQLSESGRVAVAYLPYAWMSELNVSSYEVDGVANLPMQISGVEIGITCKQQSNGSYRISMRGGDTADVSKVCALFGGGGHVKAGGCSIESGEPKEVCEKLMKAAEDSL